MHMMVPDRTEWIKTLQLDFDFNMNGSWFLLNFSHLTWKDLIIFHFSSFGLGRFPSPKMKNDVIKKKGAANQLFVFLTRDTVSSESVWQQPVQEVKRLVCQIRAERETTDDGADYHTKRLKLFCVQKKRKKTDGNVQNIQLGDDKRFAPRYNWSVCLSTVYLKVIITYFK